MMPPGHGCVGKSSSSGNLVDLVCRQTNLRPFCPFDWPALFVVGLPTVIRKPLRARCQDINTQEMLWIDGARHILV